MLWKRLERLIFFFFFLLYCRSKRNYDKLFVRKNSDITWNIFVFMNFCRYAILWQRHNFRLKITWNFILFYVSFKWFLPTWIKNFILNYKLKPESIFSQSYYITFFRMCIFFTTNYHHIFGFPDFRRITIWFIYAHHVLYPNQFCYKWRDGM